MDLLSAARAGFATIDADPALKDTALANLNAWHAANPPYYLKDTNPETTDQEPGGVFHSMIALGRHLSVVETNRGFLLRVDPSSGSIANTPRWSSASSWTIFGI